MLHLKLAYLLYRGSSDNSSMKLFGLFHLYYPVHSTYCGAMAISWKMYCEFDQGTAHRISHKSLHKLFFVIICKTQGTMDLWYFPWQPQSAQCLQGLDALLIF